MNPSLGGPTFQPPRVLYSQNQLTTTLTDQSSLESTAAAG